MFVRFVIAAVFLVLSAAASAQHRFDPDEGTLSSGRPRIPEPMVFDLVRPLGAVRGELEVNSLFRVNASSPVHLQWAPEVEYTFADGYGIEFELPLVDGGIESTKAAVQGTLPGPRPKRFIHGWQGIWERSVEGETDVDLLYLAGARVHRRWSVFSMTGARRAEHDHDARMVALGNYSVFFDASKRTTLGLETNLSRDSEGAWRTLLMPQVHARSSRLNLQGGVGVLRADGRYVVQMALRFSREF